MRSFGGVFNDTKRILRENLGAFLGVLVLLIGPVVLVTTTLNIYYSNYLFDGSQMYERDNYGTWLTVEALLAQTRALINGLFTALVISHFLKVCREKGSGKFVVADVTASLRRDWVAGTLQFIVLFVMCAALAFSLVAILLWISSVSVGIMALVTFFTAIGFLLVRYPFWYLVFSIFMARSSTVGAGAEARQPGWFASIHLAINMLRGHWWKTWALMFCLWLLLLVVGYLTTVTSSFGTQILELFSINTSFDEVTNKLVQTLLQTVSEFARALVNTVFCVGVGLHYYSLKEFQFGHTITEQLNQIGSNRPDDDVELSY